jgi:multiple sugar transport system substrate-binding protein
MMKFRSSKAHPSLLVKTVSLCLSLLMLSGCGGTAAPAASSSAAASSEAPAASSEAAASTEASSAAPSGNSGTLRVTWWGNQTRNDRTVAAIQLFESNNPGVMIEYEFTDWGGYWDKLATQAAGGTMPDVIQHDYAYLAQYVSSNQLMSLTPAVESGKLPLDNVPESILAGGTIDGQLYGLCLGTNAPVMIYDKELTEQAGVTIPAQPTIDELYEIGQTMFEKTGKYTIYDGGANALSLEARAYGKVIFDEILAGTDTYPKAHLINVERFAKAPFAIPAEIQAERNPDVVETKPILDRTTWNDYAFSNMYIAISNAAGGKLGMCMNPAPAGAQRNTMYLKPSQFFTIAETSQNKDTAVAFLDFFTNDIECNKILLAERGIPVSTVVADGIKSEVDEQTVLVFDYIAEVGKVATPIDPPNPPGAGEMDIYLKQLSEQIRYGAIDAEKATTTFMTDAKKILDDASKE